MNKIADKIIESKPLEGLRLFSLKTGIKEVVTIRGSLLAGRWFGGKNPMLADLVASMLSEGTKKRGKKAINERLESLGASIEFSADQFRLRFKIKCLRPDTKKVLEILSEELRQPAFSEKNFEPIKKRIIARLKQQEENTYSRAYNVLTRELFPAGHPNHLPPVEKNIAAVEKTTVVDLEKFQSKNFGLGNLIISAVGDIPETILTKTLAEELAGWKNSGNVIPNISSVSAPKPKEITVKVADKTSIDIVTGVATGLTEEDSDYDIFNTGLFALGGNFSSRLVNEIREKRGLTYHSHTSLEAGADGVESFWLANASFAPSLLEKGKNILKKEIEKWADRGISAKELEIKKETISGNFLVGLSTTEGLAKVILDNAEQGRAKEYIDQYPEIIRALSLKQVNDSIKKYSQPDNLVTVLAGTI